MSTRRVKSKMLLNEFKKIAHNNAFVEIETVDRYEDYTFKPNTIKNQLNNVLVQNLGTLIKGIAASFAFGFCPVSIYFGKGMVI